MYRPHRLYAHAVRTCATTAAAAPPVPPPAAPAPFKSVTYKRTPTVEVKAFHRWDNNKWAMVLPRTYTESCEAPAIMHSHQGMTLNKKTRRLLSGEVEEVLAKERLYDHPPELTPSALSHMHINRMYCMGNDDLRRFYPEGVGGKVSQLFPPGHPRGFLYRKQSHMLKVYIDKVAKCKDETRREVLRTLRGGTAGFILDGETGTGKSALCVQAVHYARGQGVLTLYVPDAKQWSHGEWSWPNILLPGFFDVPDATRDMLKYFARAHPDILKKLPLQVTPKDLPLADGETAIKTIYDLCEWGHRAQAPTSIERQSIAVKYLMDELLALPKDVPVMYVVDGMNLLAMDTHFRYPHPDYLRSFSSFEEAGTDMDMFVKEMPRIPSARLTFVRGLNKAMANVVSGALPSQSVIGCTTRYTKDDTHSLTFPEATRNKEYNALDEYAPFYADKDTMLHPITVPRFDEYEYRSFLRFLVNSGELAGFGWGPLWHHSSSFERKLYKIDFMSGRNPQRVVDHYHQEFLWSKEYERIRQKQYKTEEMSRAAAARPKRD